MSTFNIVPALFVFAGCLCALYVLFDLRHHPQPMPIMRSVWVLTGLWAGVLGIWLYRRLGRAKPTTSGEMLHEMKMPSDTEPPAAHEMSMQPESAMTSMAGMEGMRMPAKHSGWRSVVRSTLHCGAGCTLADLIGEGFLYFVPIAVGGSFVLGSWVFDYLLALVLGIYFQFSAIRSMRQTPKSKAFEQAVKADFLSLTAWQVGMYGWMALTIALWPGMMAERTTWSFWFSMQIGMLCGFICSYPVNILLIRYGIKSAME